MATCPHTGDYEPLPHPFTTYRAELVREGGWSTRIDTVAVAAEATLRRYQARAASATSRLLSAAGIPVPIAVFWVLVATMDFANDWLIAGLANEFQPVGIPLRDVLVWWTPWIMVTPLLLRVTRRLTPDRLGWGRCLAAHAAVMLVAITAHGLLVAWIFDLVGNAHGMTWWRFRSFAARFTLSESLLYWGFVATAHLGERSRHEDDAEAAQDPATTPVSRFAVRDGDVTRFVPVDQVDYIEAAGNYVRLHVGTDQHLIRATLSGVLERLDPAHFRRIHRSTVVNVNRVHEVATWFNGDHLLTLCDGRQLRVSRTFRDDLLAPFS